MLPISTRIAKLVRCASGFACLVLASTAASIATAQSQGPSVETCIGCHAPGEEAPVGNVADARDMHHVDLNPAGPESLSGYRQWNVEPYAVDVTGANTIIEFRVSDENGADVENVFDTDGRLVLARLVDPVDPMIPETGGSPTAWERLVQERFTAGGTFDHLGNGMYRFEAVYDPGSAPIAAGDTLRAAIQLSASDIPPGNGWCDFDANLAVVNDCTTPTAVHRDIIRTDTCNGCHGVTSDTMLSFHGGGRTEVEYCVTCHNVDRNPETAFTTLAHKIHYGSSLTMEWLGGDYEHVSFTRDIDDCQSCHMPGPQDADNWKTKPHREACGSCHDDVNFDTGEGHGSGGQQPTNRFCGNCHPPEGPLTLAQLPIATVHLGGARRAEGARYRGEGNGFAVESAVFDREAQTLTVQYSVTRDGEKMDLASDPEWTNNPRLNIDLAWSTEDYSNEGALSEPAPAQPVSFPALDIGGTVEDLGNGSYELVIDVSEYGFGSVTVGLEGYPRADLLGNGSYEQIPVRSAYRTASLEPRQPARARRSVIDIAKCNQCHDHGGAGLSLHGTNRTGEDQVCVLCHNPDATDIRRRPADPMEAIDGKREESVDFKRLIHMIHMGGDLEEPIVVYGFGNNAHDYSFVNFIGNARNCLTCHRPGTYGADDAWHAAPTTVDSGADPTTPGDDLNISPVTSVCSSCHDTERAKEHMVANGGTFGSFDDEIAIPAPEPAAGLLSAAALGMVSWLARQRRRQ